MHKVKSVFFQWLTCFLSIHRFSSWPCADLKTTAVNTGSKVKLSKGEITIIQHKRAPFSTWSNFQYFLVILSFRSTAQIPREAFHTVNHFHQTCFCCISIGSCFREEICVGIIFAATCHAPLLHFEKRNRGQISFLQAARNMTSFSGFV